jgi:hypothetical protein
MSQPEARLSRDIQKAIRAKGWFCFKIHGNEFMTAGLPDIVGVAEGMFFGVETKMPAKRDNVSARQLYVHNNIIAAGGFVIVACSAGEAITRINEMLNRSIRQRKGRDDMQEGRPID